MPIPFLSWAFWLARWALFRDQVKARISGHAGQAIAIGVAALAAIVVGAALVHWLTPAPPRHQTAEEVVIDAQAVTIGEHRAAIERAEHAETAAETERERVATLQSRVADLSRELDDLTRRPGNRMRCIDDEVLAKLRAKIRGTK